MVRRLRCLISYPGVSIWASRAVTLVWAFSLPEEETCLPHNNHSGNNGGEVWGEGNHNGNKPSITLHWQIYGWRQDTLGNDMHIYEYMQTNKRLFVYIQTNRPQPVHQQLDVMIQWERVGWRVSETKGFVGWVSNPSTITPFTWAACYYSHINTQCKYSNTLQKQLSSHHGVRWK